MASTQHKPLPIGSGFLLIVIMEEVKNVDR